MSIEITKQASEKENYSSSSSKSQAAECTDVHPDSDCVNSSNSPPVPRVKRKVDLKNEPKVKPGEMLEDYKFTQH